MKEKKHLSIIKIILSVSILILGIFLIVCSTSVKLATTKTVLTYSEKSDTSYKVYLKENTIFQEKYLGENKQYITNIIDHINLKYNYSFISDKKSDIEYKYKIIAYVEINDNNTKKSVWSNDYTIKNETNSLIENDNGYVITELLDIDYDYYNQIAGEIRQKYAQDTTATLQIKLVVNTELENEFIDDESSNKEVLVTIPLQSETIGIDKTTVDNTKNIKGKITTNIKNIYFLLAGIIFILISIVLIVGEFLNAYKINNYQNKDKIVFRKAKKMVKELDELITRTYKMPSLKDKKVREVPLEKIIELQDKLDCSMIMVDKEEEVIFIIKTETKAYTCTVKKLKKRVK